MEAGAAVRQAVTREVAAEAEAAAKRVAATRAVKAAQRRPLMKNPSLHHRNLQD